MAPLPDYVSGTITLTNGSAAFTGSGTGWLAASFREGDTILGIEDNPGVIYVIESITDNDAGTLTQPWDGPTGTYTYRMRYLSDGQRVTAQARTLIELLGNGNLQAEAGLTGAADTLSYYTGPAAKALAPLTAFARTLLDDANAAEFWETIGATSPPGSAFRRGNVLGTVSQSGGVPTGALIEQGSNANGGYMRFAGGLQVCWIDSVMLSRTASATVAGAWTYPASFGSGPKALTFSILDVLPSGFREVQHRVISTSLSAGTLQVLQNGAWPDPMDILVQAMAIGRWS